MSMHGRFTGRLLKSEKKFGLTAVSIRLDGPNDVIGINEVQAIVDPDVPDKAAEQALKWDVGELIQLEGEVVKIGKCECCGNPLPVVDAIKCSLVRKRSPSLVIGFLPNTSMPMSCRSLREHSGCAPTTVDFSLQYVGKGEAILNAKAVTIIGVPVPTAPSNFRCYLDAIVGKRHPTLTWPTPLIVEVALDFRSSPATLVFRTQCEKVDIHRPSKTMTA
jgi:hypothetical protein